MLQKHYKEVVFISIGEEVYVKIATKAWDDLGYYMLADAIIKEVLNDNFYDISFTGDAHVMCIDENQIKERTDITKIMLAGMRCKGDILIRKTERVI